MIVYRLVVSRLLPVCLLSISILLSHCSQSQTPVAAKLPVDEIAARLKENPEAVLIDVRRPDEFARGHIPGAILMDWNGKEFKSAIKSMDQQTPYYVYCLSGSRSAAAAQYMRAAGFTAVYEMDGGIMAWRGANLPEASAENASPGMTVTHFDSLLIDERPVLVNFYADWCAPCRKMKPYLDEMSTAEAATLKLVRINADDNPLLCKSLNVTSLPVMQLYKDKKITWTHSGFISREDLIKAISGQ